MTDRMIAFITNGATTALCGQANLAQSVWWCSSESPIEESEEETEGLCLCETLKTLRQPPGPKNTLLFLALLYSTLLWTPSKASLAASMEALFCGGTDTHTHTDVWTAVQI